MENLKISLVKEAFTHMYQIALAYQNQVQEKDHEIEKLKLRIRELEAGNFELAELVRQYETEKNQESQKQLEVQKQIEVNDKYLKDIAGTVDKIRKGQTKLQGEVEKLKKSTVSQSEEIRLMLEKQLEDTVRDTE